MPDMLQARDPGSPLLSNEIDREVERLPSMQARAFRMREFEGQEVPAICAAMGIDEGRLSDLLLDARLSLCRALFR